MSWVHRRSDACPVPGAHSFPGGLVIRLYIFFCYDFLRLRADSKQRVRLLGGPPLGFSLCIPGRLALLVEPSPGGMLRVSLTSGSTFWVEGRTLACVEVHRESYACSVSIAFPFLQRLALGLCSSRYNRCVVLVLGGLAIGAGPGLTVGACEGLCPVSISIGGGIKCFVRLCINEAITVGAVYSAMNRKDSGFSIRAGEDFLENRSVKIFSELKVDEGRQSIEYYFHPG
eukprot:1142031-Pelagomonas_calceolata.AAC.2